MVDVVEKYMQKCLDLAKKGLGAVAPNPMVGCVIVYQDEIIGEGYHQKFGEAHAEVNAINSVKDRSLLSKSTLYVNLEPCSHHGKTPPCADLIANLRIPNVVIGRIDTSQKVSGKGVEKLKHARCNVRVGVLERQCHELNKRFYTFHEKNRPYIILKWAESKDGFIDAIRENNHQRPVWFTNDECRVLVHKWRTQEQSIMVGTNTALLDNPKLNVREWQGENPTRIVLDKTLRLPTDLNLFDKSIPTLVFTEQKAESQHNLKYIQIDFSTDLIKNILYELHQEEIQSVIIEGGQILLNTFIEQNLWDEARVFVGDVILNKGIPAPKLKQEASSQENIKESRLFCYQGRA